MKKSLILKIIVPIPLLFMLYMIFFFSGQPGETSGGLSNRLCVWLVNLWSSIFSRSLTDIQFHNTADALEPFIRKLAHITEYFFLTGTVYLPVSVYTLKERYILATENSAYALAKLKNNHYHKSRSHTIKAIFRVLISAGVTVLFAAGDELHQYFVPGRSGRLFDVCIDSIGILFASLIIYFFVRNDN